MVVADYDLYEFYSCFLVVFKMVGDVLGLGVLVWFSVVGGLSFFGVLFNSYMIYVVIVMVWVLWVG